MKLRTLAVITTAAALAGLAGCDRAEQDRVSGARAPGAPPPNTAPTPRTAGQTIDDAGITAKVKAALLAEKGVDGLRIDVDTTQGNVTLSGKVPDAAQIERATQIARAVDGVRGVDNKLTVGAS